MFGRTNLTVGYVPLQMLLPAELLSAIGTKQTGRGWRRLASAGCRRNRRRNTRRHGDIGRCNARLEGSGGGGERDSMPYEEGQASLGQSGYVWWCICKDVAQRRCGVVEDACRAGAVVDDRVWMSPRYVLGMEWRNDGWADGCKRAQVR